MAVAVTGKIAQVLQLADVLYEMLIPVMPRQQSTMGVWHVSLGHFQLP